MRATRRSIFAAAIALWLAAGFSGPAAAQDLADRRLETAMRRSFLWEYWAARQQEQIDFAHYRSHAQFGHYGQRYGAQPLLGYRAYGPQKPFGAAPRTGSGAVAASGYCVGPLGIECSPLDCDCGY